MVSDWVSHISNSSLDQDTASGAVVATRHHLDAARMTAAVFDFLVWLGLGNCAWGAPWTFWEKYPIQPSFCVIQNLYFGVYQIFISTPLDFGNGTPLSRHSKAGESWCKRLLQYLQSFRPSVYLIVAGCPAIHPFLTNKLPNKILLNLQSWTYLVVSGKSPPVQIPIQASKFKVLHTNIVYVLM